MCKLLDGMVLVKVSVGGGQQTRQDKEATERIRAATGDKYKTVTDKLYPTKPFGEVHGVLTGLKGYIKKRAVCANMDSSWFTPVKCVGDIRSEVASVRAKVSALCTDLHRRHDEIVDQQIAARGGDSRLIDDYPAVFPLEDWFYLEVNWMPHPKESPLAGVMREANEQLVSSLQAEMTEQAKEHIEAARKSLMKRVEDAVKGVAYKAMRLRCDTYYCNECDRQWPQASQNFCPKCGSTDVKAQDKEKRVFDTVMDPVKELAETLGVIIPEDVISADGLHDALSPVMEITPDDMREASPVVLVDIEQTCRNTARTLADIVNATFV